MVNRLPIHYYYHGNYYHGYYHMLYIITYYHTYLLLPFTFYHYYLWLRREDDASAEWWPPSTTPQRRTNEVRLSLNCFPEKKTAEDSREKRQTTFFSFGSISEFEVFSFPSFHHGQPLQARHDPGRKSEGGTRRLYRQVPQRRGRPRSPHVANGGHDAPWRGATADAQHRRASQAHPSPRACQPSDHWRRQARSHHAPSPCGTGARVVARPSRAQPPETPSSRLSCCADRCTS